MTIAKLALKVAQKLDEGALLHNSGAEYPLTNKQLEQPIRVIMEVLTDENYRQVVEGK